MRFVFVWLLYAACFILLVFAMANIYVIDKKEAVSGKRRCLTLKRFHKLFLSSDSDCPGKIALRTLWRELILYFLFIAMIVLLVVSYYADDPVKLSAYGVYAAVTLFFTLYTTVRRFRR